MIKRINVIKRIGLVLVWGLVAGEGYSQNPLVKQWDKRFGGIADDYLHSFHQTSDSGFMMGGFSFSGISGDKTQATLGHSDYWIVKTDLSGNKQWDKNFGGTDYDYLYSIEQTADGGYILGGYSKSGISGDKTQANWDASGFTNDYWIVKTDSLGNKQWDKDLGGTNDDRLYSLQQTSDGGFILGGYSESGISGDKTQANWNASGNSADFWIVKIDSAGNKQWDKDFGGTSDDVLYSIQQTADGGYIFGGYSWSGISGDKTQAAWGLMDYWIVKTDSLCNKQWDKNFGGTNGDYLFSIKQTADRRYILGGWSNSGINGDKTHASWGGADYWIIKTDSLGNKQWDKDFGGINDDELDFGNVTQTSDDGYLLCGTSYSAISGDKTENNLGGEQGWIVKTDSLGIKQWDKTIFTNAHDETYLAIQTNDGCYAIAGYTYAGIAGYKTQSSWNNSNDYWLIKFCDSTLTTSITQLPNTQLPFTIYPNPTTSTIQLTFNTKHNAQLMCEIINVMGERVFRKEFKQTDPDMHRDDEHSGRANVQLDVSFLAKGMYVVRVGDGTVWENKKLVVQ
jgi:hypothetical protein